MAHYPPPVTHRSPSSKCFFRDGSCGGGSPSCDSAAAMADMLCLATRRSFIISCSFNADANVASPRQDPPAVSSSRSGGDGARFSVDEDEDGGVLGRMCMAVRKL